MISRPLRIGFFSDTYLPSVNGVAISLHLLAQALRSAGHDIAIFTPRIPEYHDHEDQVCRIPALRFVDDPPLYLALPCTPRTTLALLRCQLDVVHAHTPVTAGFLAYATARLNRIPLIYTYQTYLAHYAHYIKLLGQTSLALPMAKWFSATTSNLADWIVAPSAKIERLLREQGTHRPIRVIPNGINLDHFSQPTSRGMFRRALDLDQSTPLLLFVGRLGPEKRPDFLIEAFACLARVHASVHILIAGDGPARFALQKAAAESGYGNRIRFLGIVDRTELPCLMYDADIFLSASTTEVHPLVVIEAIASGLPLIAVWDEALEGMLVDGINGRVVAREAEPFSAAICDLLANRSTLKAFGQASLELSKQYSVEAQATAMLELYEAAIANSYSCGNG